MVVRGRGLEVGDAEDLCGLEVLARGDTVGLRDEPLRDDCGPELPGII